MNIKNRWTGNIIMTTDGADLRGANLYGANLCGADLRGAKYGEEILRGFLQISPIGSRNSTLQIFGVGPVNLLFKTGCFSGNTKEFTEIISKTHGDRVYATDYLAAIEFAKLMIPTI